MPSNTLGLRLLAGEVASLPFVVGDDDQSIYRWRGARVENISALSAAFSKRRVDSPGAELSFHRRIFSRPQTLSSRNNSVPTWARSYGRTVQKAIRFGSIRCVQ